MGISQFSLKFQHSFNTCTKHSAYSQNMVKMIHVHFQAGVSMRGKLLNTLQLETAGYVKHLLLENDRMQLSSSGIINIFPHLYNSKYKLLQTSKAKKLATLVHDKSTFCCRKFPLPNMHLYLFLKIIKWKTHALLYREHWLHAHRGQVCGTDKLTKQ